MWIECVGALHIHTLYSDGSAGMEQVLQAAEKAGLDFVVVSDHDSLAGRREEWEGCHDGMEVLVAGEITPRFEPHMLAMRVAQCAGYATLPNRRTLDAIQEQGGYTIVAHPQGKRRFWPHVDQKPWRDWEHPCISGMEIWAYMHDWVARVKWWRFPVAHISCSAPERIVRGPEKTILAVWDEIGRWRRLAGVGGLDCHARRIPSLGVSIFAYERMFRFLRNHFFIRRDTPAGARGAALWEALEKGRGFVAHDILADSAGARCFGCMPDGTRIMMGEERAFVAGTTLTITLPCRAEIRWIVNGRCRIREVAETLAVRPVEPGVYRFEARLFGRPWLFTNPFYLR